MRWRGRRRSENIDDRRGHRLTRGRRKMGGGAMIIVVLVGLFFGQDVSNILGLVLSNSGTQNQYEAKQSNGTNQAKNDEAAQFVSVVLAETEDTWNRVFSKMGQRYQAPKLVLYRSMVQSACGTSSAASGPFYCPGDHQVYIDLSFLQELRNMGASGDFAFAYVIAHEVGTMFKTFWVSQIKCERVRPAHQKYRAMLFLSVWSCKRIAWLECGLTIPRSEIVS